MLNSEFPNYFQASDKASNEAQSTYLNIIKIDLISMIIASALAIYNYHQVESKLYVYSISGFLLLLSLILTVILKSKKYEDIWYQGRALAESCKTLTWRFVTCSEFFEKSLTEIEAKERFSLRIKDLSNEFKDLSSNLNSKILNLPIISDKMIELRKLNIVQRKQNYILNRIEDQKKWYSDKAEFNKTKYNQWFWIIIFCQAISLISIIILIKFPNNNFNLVGLFTTIASSAISWLHLKQHQELKQAYTTATQELNFIVTLAEKITTDDEFSKFVLDSENAISREHTLWLAQKRK